MSGRTLGLAIFMLVCLTAFHAAAQTVFEKVLLPIDLHSPVPGNQGSLWETRLWIVNDGTQAVEMGNWQGVCSVPCGPNSSVPPGLTLRTSHSIAGPAGFPGTFLFVDATYVDRFGFRLNVFDNTRTNEADGTEIPVVRAREFHEVVNLLDIPAWGPNFRHTIRVYSLDGSRAGSVRIRVYRIKVGGVPVEGNDLLLGEATLPLLLPFDEGHYAFPGYLQINDLRSIAPSVAETDRLRVRVESIDPDVRIWAFASVTSNTTSVVTTSTPFQ